MLATLLVLTAVYASSASAWKYPDLTIAGVTNKSIAVLVIPHDKPYKNNGRIAIHAVPLLNNTCGTSVRPVTHDFPGQPVVLQNPNVCPDTWYAVCSEFRAVISNRSDAVASGSCEVRKTMGKYGGRTDAILMPNEFRAMTGNQIQVSFSTPSGLPITATSWFPGKSALSKSLAGSESGFTLTFGGMDPVNQPFRRFCYTWDFNSALRVFAYVDSTGFEVKQTICGTFGVEKYNSAGQLTLSVALLLVTPVLRMLFF